MPSNAGSRVQLICACFVVVVALPAPLMLARAAINARLNPDEARDAAPFVYSMPEGEVSLTGFHCGSISEDSAAAFAADPDDSASPPTIGLELVLDADSQSSPGRAGTQDLVAADVKNPLSARLSRIIVGDAAPSLSDGGTLEEVSLPEASMSVADLIGRCRP